jgi:phosphoglycerate dehydrogenase-like enzyme
MTRVLITFPGEPDRAFLARLRTVAPGVEVRCWHYEDSDEIRSAKRRRAAFVPPPVPEGLRTELAEAEVILGLDLPMGVAALTPRLRWLQVASTGIDQLEPVGLAPSVVITTAKGLRDVPIAEFVIARVLGVWKRARDLEALQARHRWEQTLGRVVAGSSMVVVGLGSIGGEVARLATGLGMEVRGVRRHPSPHPACVEVLGTDDLDAVLGLADVVVVAVAGTPETADLFGARAFAAMKPGATFCNIARGSVVDENALVDALVSGQLGSAILDVVRSEPLATDSALWEAPNVYLSPHSSASDDGHAGLFELFTGNLRRWLHGEPLRNVVESAPGA